MKKELQNPKFVFRDMKISDLQGYWEVCQDKEAQRNWTSYPKNHEEVREEWNRMVQEVKNKGSTIFTIIVNKQYAGNVILQYQDFDKKRNEGRVHLWIHPNFRGRGLATEALRELILYGFEKKKMKRIFVQCKAINKGIMRISKKIGFSVVKRFVNDLGVEKVLWVKENTLINKKKYKFLPYDKRDPILFEKEKLKIVKFLGKNIIIEHVGSTSIPGLGGKGIIDIAIKTPKNKVKYFIKKLEKLGYGYEIDHPAGNKSIFLQKIIKSNGYERRIHVHLTLDNDFWKTFIVFRDYLRNNYKERDKYAKLKEKAVRFANGDIKKYRKYKTNFLEKTTKKALKELR